MKRFMICLMALTILVSLAACAGTKSQDKLEQEMKEAYMRQFVEEDDYSIENLSIAHYGEYDGCQVVFVNGYFMYLQALSGETVAGYNFRYSSSQKLLAYKDGTYQYLQEAYDDGWLSDEAIGELHAAYKQANSFLYDE